MEIKTNTWWEAQNTGWSGGVSWFNSSGSESRFKSKKEAVDFNKGCMAKLPDPGTKWRVVKITLIGESYLMEATE